MIWEKEERDSTIKYNGEMSSIPKDEKSLTQSPVNEKYSDRNASFFNDSYAAQSLIGKYKLSSVYCFIFSNVHKCLLFF